MQRQKNGGQSEVQLIANSIYQQNVQEKLSSLFAKNIAPQVIPKTFDPPKILTPKTFYSQ